MKVKDIVNKKIVSEDLIVGEVKEVLFDPKQWKITHLEVKLTKDAADVALGIEKGGIMNLLAVSAVGDIGEQINLKVKKGQLRIYLIPTPKQ